MGHLKYSELRSYAKKSVLAESLTLEVAKAQSKKTIFLSHSHRDKDLAEGLKNRLLEQDADVYIDWQDSSMPEITNKETAIKIKNKISSHDIFMFLATDNSCNSRWCPWEIGYADGVKLHKEIVIGVNAFLS